MLNFKPHYLFITPFSLILALISYPFFNLVKLTYTFEQKNTIPIDEINYSYAIYSSDKKIIRKLSSKFDISNDKELIPPLLRNAFISGEDKNFLSHHGIDLISLFRAFRNNFQSGYIREGGSTITQQVSRLIFLNNELSFKRKIKEIIISILLDSRFDKNQILKIYLNNIYLGSGAYGINEASQVYFGKLIKELNLTEIALLAGLAPAPSIYSPFNNYNLAIKNRDRILLSMYSDGYISKKDLDKAMREKIILNNSQSKNIYVNDDVLINFILDQVNKIIKEDLKKGDLNLIKIKTSINSKWQNIAQNLAKNIKPKKLEIALITIESNNGLIRTMVSGKDVNFNSFNRAISAIRPLSSTFKIITYITALNNNKSLKDKYYDIPTCWSNYCPKNFSDRYEGKISLIEAFKNSSNIVPIKISEELGLEEIIKVANKFGLGYSQEMKNNLSAAIGAYSDSLINITNVYSTINNEGELIQPSILEKIENYNGEIIWENKYKGKRVIDKKLIKKLNFILEKSVSEGNGMAASIKGQKIFGKTGTSDGNRDLWFIGSLKKNTTGIWLGSDDFKETNLSSGNAAAFWKLYINKIKSF